MCGWTGVIYKALFPLELTMDLRELDNNRTGLLRQILHISTQAELEHKSILGKGELVTN